jgi:hypothetical protein
MPEPVDHRHLLLIGAGPGVGASIVRRFGRERFRSTLISRGATLEQLAAELRRDGLEIEAVVADIEDLDGYRAALERIFGGRPRRASWSHSGRCRARARRACPARSELAADVAGRAPPWRVAHGAGGVAVYASSGWANAGNIPPENRPFWLADAE